MAMWKHYADVMRKHYTIQKDHQYQSDVNHADKIISNTIRGIDREYELDQNLVEVISSVKQWIEDE